MFTHHKQLESVLEKRTPRSGLDLVMFRGMSSPGDRGHSLLLFICFLPRPEGVYATRVQYYTKVNTSAPAWVLRQFKGVQARLKHIEYRTHPSIYSPV